MYTKYFIATLLVVLSICDNNKCWSQSAYPNNSAMHLDQTLTYFMQADTYAAANNHMYMFPPQEDIYERYYHPCPPELKQDLNKLSRLYKTGNLKAYKKALNKLEQKYTDPPPQVKDKLKK